jgi:hypothetical protein
LRNPFGVGKSVRPGKITPRHFAMTVSLKLFNATRTLAAAMQSKAKTVKEYLAELPADRRAAIEAVRKTIRKNLGKGYQEGMQYGMIGYFVPHSLYPQGYHCDPSQPLPFASLASQKSYMSLYLFAIYADPKDSAWFEKEWAKTGKKLDRGKCCVRFKKLDDLPLELIGETIRRMPVKRHIELYEKALQTPRRAVKPKQSAPRTAKKKTKKQAAKKSPSKAKA